MTQPPGTPGTPAKVVTRFAPSPTGYLHIGGARTALFSWAFARRHAGTFILRIEDTDVARSTAESTRQIIEDMKWLGLAWDEGPAPDAADVYDIASQQGPHGPYFQSQRGAIYIQYLDRMRQAGRAYRCFKTPDQLKAERERARAEKRPEKYDPTEALNRTEAEQQRLIDAGTPFVWRFRMPDTDITVHDQVLGDVTIRREELEDFVIMKSGLGGVGAGPTFNFANIVDDATMEVTHVLRGQDHLMNTPRHVAMFEALGLPVPVYAHMPLIFNLDGTRMSKRDKAKTARAAAQVWLKQSGNSVDKLWDAVNQPASVGDAAVPGFDLAVLVGFIEKKNDEPAVAIALARTLGVALPEIDVHDFRVSGYLKDVVLNSVSLLGWSPPGENVQRFDLDFLKANFAIESIGKSNARFDRAKPLAFNADTIAKMPPEEFVQRLKAYIEFRRDIYADVLAKFDDAKLRQFAVAYQLRARTLQDPLVAGRFFFVGDAEFAYDAAAVKKVMEKNNGAGYTALSDARDVLAGVDPWEPIPIHAALEAFASRTGRQVGDVAQPLRVAVSGGTVSPPIDQTLALLGKASTLARIDRCLALQAGAPR